MIPLACSAPRYGLSRNKPDSSPKLQGGVHVKIAVCDDEQNALEHASAQIASIIADCEVKTFLNASDMMELIKDGVKFDAVFMDIEWHGEQKGIDFAAELFRLSPKTKIIFVTGYPQRYSQQVFLKSTNIKGFISKPIDPAILLKNLEKIKDEMIREGNRKLLLKFSGVVTSVDPDDILYIESRANTATVYSTGGGHLCYEKLDDLAKRLPGSFIRTHKSFLVNMDKIQYIERERVILEKNMEVPISKTRYNGLREQYFRYVGTSGW